MRRSVRRAGMVLAAALLSACATSRPAEYFPTQSGPPRPFSPAVKLHGLIYLSGQVGTDARGALVKGGIQAETRQVMQNIGAVLERTGSGWDRVVKCTVFMADMSEWGAMNEVYVTFFPAGKLPARSAMGANGLALNAKVEIECIAH